MKPRKSAGPDGIVTEMIMALEDYGIDKLTDVINKIYDTGEFPTDLSKSIFVAIPKKPGAIECEHHRLISLMSHITKIIMRILLLRARNRITPEIGVEQFGFVKDSGTRNAIFTLKNLVERAIEMKRDVFLCFVDYTKAFDKVRHDSLFKDLKTLNLPGKDIRLLQHLYWHQKACVRVEGELSEYTNIERGVRQGCVMSPDLFNLYTEFVMRAVERKRGFRIGGKNITNLRYADDTVLLAESQRDLQKLIDVLVRESERKGLSLNCKKTECMVVSKKSATPQCELFVNGQKIQQVSNFNYLGSLITEDSRSEKEIRRRITLTKAAFYKLGNILRNISITMKTRSRVLHCYINPILMYGCKTWTLSKTTEKLLESCEMWLLRRMLRIPWTSHTTNEEVLKKAGTERSLLRNIRSRQGKFLGHAMRKEGLEQLSLTGKIQGKRAKGRQRTTFMMAWKEQMGQDQSKARLLQLTLDRDSWRHMVANVK